MMELKYCTSSQNPLIIFTSNAAPRRKCFTNKNMTVEGYEKSGKKSDPLLKKV